MAWNDFLGGLVDTGQRGLGGIWDWSKSNPMGVLAGGSTLAGVMSNIYGQMQQKAAMDKYLHTAKQPINMQPYFQQATQAEMEQMKRMVGTGLAERGVQPGGYWDAQMMEAINKDTSQRTSDAYGRAQSAKEQLLQSLAAKAGMKPMQLGDTGAIGKYLQYMTEKNAREAAQRRQAGAYNPSPGQVETGGLMPTPYGGNIPNLQLGPGGQTMGSEPGGFGDYTGAY